MKLLVEDSLDTGMVVWEYAASVMDGGVARSRVTLDFDFGAHGS